MFLWGVNGFMIRKLCLFIWLTILACSFCTFRIYPNFQGHTKTMASYEYNWYLFWYQCKEETHSYLPFHDNTDWHIDLFWYNCQSLSKASIARFQIKVLVRFGSVWLWLVMVLLIVWPRSLLLCPFHKKLRIWWKKSFGFCQTDNPRFIFIMYCYRYRQLTSKNPDVSEFSTLRKSTKRKSLVIRTWDFP